MKKHYHFYVVYAVNDTKQDRIIDFDSMIIQLDNKFLSGKDIADIENLIMMGMDDETDNPIIINWRRIKCDCSPEPESEDTQVSEVLEAIEEREKCKETKRMMGHE